MDRKQLIVQRARELLGDRLNDVLHMVRQDRHDLYGWEEPPHVRAVLRRATHEENGDSVMTLVATESGRAAGEPNPTQQREGVGMMLECAASALQKCLESDRPDLTCDEAFGLEACLLLYARPALLVSDDKLSQPVTLWNVLEDCHRDIELVQRGVGRIELLGHPEYDWAGTACLVSENVLMTTRKTAMLFCEPSGSGANGGYQFRPGISAWMNYSACQHPHSATYRIHGVIGMHDLYDLALLQVETPQSTNGRPVPLMLASEAPATHDRQVYMVGYPVRDARRNDPEPISRIFRDVFNVKRVQPGRLRGMMDFGSLQLLQHDCATLGDSGGSCIVDMETHQVVGLHLTGRYLEKGTAAPLHLLRDDPLLQRAGVTFARADPQKVGDVISQIERLARTRHFDELCAMIASLHERAFGCGVK